MKKLSSLLEKFKVSEFDRVRVRANGLDLEGIVMPRIDIGDTNALILKLDSGYNTGISVDSIKKLEKLAAPHAKAEASKAAKAARKDKSKMGTGKSALPKIAMIATGGTIASVIEYATGGVIGQLSPEDIAKAAPGLKDKAEISFYSPFRIMSEDMTPNEWQKIAQVAAKEMAKDEIRGIIVTHGTDTLHYTSAALSFMLCEFAKPLALVGAQRSPDRGSFDGALNLECAGIYATSDIGEKAIVMHGTSNDDYCIASRGTKVRKMHSTRRDAFRPINEPALAKIWPDGKIERTNQHIRPASSAENAKAELGFEEKVAIVKAYPGCSPELLDYYSEKKFRGLIIEATALGHVPTAPIEKKDSWIPTIKRITDAGMYVGVTTQCVWGEVNPFVYTNLRRHAAAGSQFLGDMLTETAYVKLGWALARTRNIEELKRLMAQNVAGEYSSKREYAEQFAW